MKLALCFVALCLLASAGEYLNGIYLGSDVAGTERIADVAVRIQCDGTVTVYRGALVPGLHDFQGREVRVKRVVVR